MRYLAELARTRACILDGISPRDEYQRRLAQGGDVPGATPGATGTSFRPCVVTPGYLRNVSGCEVMPTPIAPVRHGAALTVMSPAKRRSYDISG